MQCKSEMVDDVDIEEHEIFDNPLLRNVFPDIAILKQELDGDAPPLETKTRRLLRAKKNTASKAAAERQQPTGTATGLPNASKHMDENIDKNTKDVHKIDKTYHQNNIQLTLELSSNDLLDSFKKEQIINNKLECDLIPKKEILVCKVCSEESEEEICKKCVLEIAENSAACSQPDRVVFQAVDNTKKKLKKSAQPDARATPGTQRARKASTAPKSSNELPEGRGLEAAMRRKRTRMLQPSNPAPPAPTSPSSPSVASPSPASCSLFSRETSMECGDSESLPNSPRASRVLHPSPPPPRRPRHLQDKDMTDLINPGSDEDSDESDGEESSIVAPVIPRVFRSMMETPLDRDVAEEDAAGTPAPASGLEPADVPPATTERPWSFDDFDWRAFPNPPVPPESRRETFSETNVGPTTPCADPYDIFVEIWDRQIMEHIASATNKYTQQLVSHMMENHKLRPTSRICRWHDTTADELYVYFGLILAMGVVVKARLEEYWGSAPDIFYTPGFSAHMSIDRFLLLNKCLHFNDNDDMRALELDRSEARLFKIRPILAHLNKKFQQMYAPAQDIALDESLLTWKGSSDIYRLSPNRGADRGIKTYEVCESQTGYLWRFQVHAHRKSAPQQRAGDPLATSAAAIVLQLIRGLEHKGYTLWMDDLYQSPSLARRLKTLGVDCAGTLRTDREFVPRALDNLTERNMRPGQVSALTSGDVDVMVWRDAHRVAMISTYHGDGQQRVRGSPKPILILDYNIMMGGLDKKDRLLTMYPVERKRTKVWYKQFFRRLLNVSVLNSFIIHHHTSSLIHRNFRIDLIKSLLSKHSTAPPIPPALAQYKVDVTHRLAELPMRRRQRLRRACIACKKHVRTFCVGCGKTVCMEPCFLTVHS